MGSYTEGQFKVRTRVKFATFRFLCEKLGPFLQKQDTPFRNSISVETRIAVSLTRLGSGNGQLLIGDLYGVAECTVSKIVREFCKAVRQHLQRIFVQMPSESQFRILAKQFEALHGIPYIVGAIDGSHIAVLAPIVGGEDYYCRKSFHSAILQGIVDVKCRFWDYEFGWAGSLHDWAVFQVTKIGRACMEGKLHPYKLIGDAAYPVRPWMYYPFKGGKTELSQIHENWNFIQSSTQMCVERAFGILKGRWRIIMRRCDVPLRMIPDIVSTCIVMHNLCITMKDGFDVDWITEAEEQLQKRIDSGDLRERQELRCERASIQEVKNRILNRDDFMATNEANDEEIEAFLLKENERAEDLLREATTMHKVLAKSLWYYKIRKESNLVFSDSSSDSIEE